MNTQPAAGILLRATARTLLPYPAYRLASRGFNRLRYKAAVLRNYEFPASRPWRALSYLLFNPEVDNFTYDISNRDELIDFLAAQFSAPAAEIRGLLHEIDGDKELANQLKQSFGRPALFGRRLGWYVIVRLAKPKLVIETGVHDGLGSTCLLLALNRNAAEGREGRLLGIDHNPRAGWLVPSFLRSRFDLKYADSAQVLRDLGPDQKVDIFLHDSDHRYEHEMLEYDLVKAQLSHNAIVMSDNAHVCDALRDFATQSERRFAMWTEKPLNHFYPGVALGIARRESLATTDSIFSD